MSELNRSLDSALNKLANGIENGKGGYAQAAFDHLITGADVHTLRNFDDIKSIKLDVVKATVANTLVQAASVIDLKGNKPEKISKNMEELGVEVKYKYGSKEDGSGVAVIVMQEGKVLMCRNMLFLPSSKECKGLQENTDYEGSHLNTMYGAVAAGGAGLVAGMVGGAVLTAGVGNLAKETVKNAANAVTSAGSAVMHGSNAHIMSEMEKKAVAEATKQVTANAAAISEAAVQEAGKKLAAEHIAAGVAEASAMPLAMTADVVKEAGVAAVEQATAEAHKAGSEYAGKMMEHAMSTMAAKSAAQVSASEAGQGAKIIGQKVAESGVATLQTVGGVVTNAATKGVNAGASVASKMGVKGAEESAKKAAEALASNTAKTVAGGAVVAVATVATVVCIYKACQYTPKVYHVAGEGGCINSFCLMKNCKDLRELGISKGGNSVFINSMDFWDVAPSRLLDAYPIVPGSHRKGLYGFFSTTSTGWPSTEDRQKAVQSKYLELLATTSMGAEQLTAAVASY